MSPPPDQATINSAESLEKMPSQGLQPREQLANPPLADNEDDSDDEITDENETEDETENDDDDDGYNNDFFTIDIPEDKPVKEEAELIEYSITTKDKAEYEAFKDRMHRVLRSGPGIKSGGFGIIREFPDPYVILRPVWDDMTPDEKYAQDKKYSKFKDVYIAKVPAERPQAFISSLVATDRTFNGSEISFRSKLLAGEEEKIRKAEGLGPYLDDYMIDEREVSIDNDHLPQQYAVPYWDGPRNPLSYQKAVWTQDEDESRLGRMSVYDQEVSQYKPDHLTSVYSESLQCEQSDEESESLVPTQIPRHFVRIEGFQSKHSWGDLVYTG